MALFDSIFSGTNGVAASLLNMMGISATYVHYTDVEYDPTTLGNFSEEAITTSTVTVSPILRYKSYERANSSIMENDCKVIGKGSDFNSVMNQKDYLTISGTDYIIVSRKDIFSGDSLAAVELQLRGRSDEQSS